MTHQQLEGSSTIYCPLAQSLGQWEILDIAKKLKSKTTQIPMFSHPIYKKLLIQSNVLCVCRWRSGVE